MNKKIIIIGLILPLLVSCKENKRVIETESRSVESIESFSSKNKTLKDQEKIEKNDSNIKDNEKASEEEKHEEIDPIFDILKGKKFVYKHVNNRYYQSLQFGENGFFNSKYTFTQTDTSGEFMDYQSICQMQGSFIVENKLDDTFYILRLVKPSIISDTGKTDIFSEDGYKHKIEYKDIKGGLATDDSQNAFQDLYTLYLPGRSKDKMSEKLRQNLENLYMNFEGESPYYMLVNNNNTGVFIEGIE
ncbi:MAG: hypothetical protein E6Z21_08530 [Anaerococcus vaginalis]|nr:hypothetical protein [Anaerococcus vaginalis]